MKIRWWAFPFLLLASSALAGALLVGFAAVLVFPTLPSLEALELPRLHRLLGDARAAA